VNPSFGLGLGIFLSQPEHLRVTDDYAPALDPRRAASNNRILDTTIFHVDQTLGCQRRSAPIPSGLPAGASGADGHQVARSHLWQRYPGREDTRPGRARRSAEGVTCSDRAEAEAWSSRWKATVGPPNRHQASAGASMADWVGLRSSATAARPARACRSTPQASTRYAGLEAEGGAERPIMPERPPRPAGAYD
jgi:hypothetical protein